MTRSRTVAPLVACFVAGLLMGLWARRPVAAPEPPAPAIELDRGLVAERLPPPAVLPEVAKEAAAATGGKPVRVGQVTVQPDVKPTFTQFANGEQTALIQPAPLTLDWSLIRTSDGHRMAFSTDDGVILSATDRPLVLTEREPKWAAMAYYLPTEKAGAAVIERDVGRLRLAGGAMVYEGRLVPMVGAGLRW